jgi:nucleoside-diphosphate-sugar epimerase
MHVSTVDGAATGAAPAVGVHAHGSAATRVAALLAAARPSWAWLPVRPGDPLHGLDAVVDLGLLAAQETDPAARRARVVGGSRALLTAARTGGVARYVAVTSAMVLGTTPGPPVARGDDTAVQPPAEDCLLADLVAVEQMLAEAPDAAPVVTVLRPAVLCGAGSDVLLGRHFVPPRLLTIRGGEACWQFCHVHDLVTAVMLALDGKVRGPAAVASDGWLAADAAAHQSGLRQLELPLAVAAATAERLFRLRLSASPPSELAFLSRPWLVECTTLRAAGWRPAHSNAAALQAQLDLLAAERAVTRPTGRSLAGAGVSAAALLGSAAAVRAARRRRGGS